MAKLPMLRRTFQGAQESLRLASLDNHPAPEDKSIRLERIAAIQRSIAAGTYRISASEVAGKLIAHMLSNRPPRT